MTRPAPPLGAFWDATSGWLVGHRAVPPPPAGSLPRVGGRGRRSLTPQGTGLEGAGPWLVGAGLVVRAQGPRLGHLHGLDTPLGVLDHILVVSSIGAARRGGRPAPRGRPGPGRGRRVGGRPRRGLAVSQTRVLGTGQAGADVVALLDHVAGLSDHRAPRTTWSGRPRPCSTTAASSAFPPRASPTTPPRWLSATTGVDHDRLGPRHLHERGRGTARGAGRTSSVVRPSPTEPGGGAPTGTSKRPTSWARVGWRWAAGRSTGRTGRAGRDHAAGRRGGSTWALPPRPARTWRRRSRAGEGHGFAAEVAVGPARTSCAVARDAGEGPTPVLASDAPGRVGAYCLSVDPAPAS